MLNKNWSIHAIYGIIFVVLLSIILIVRKPCEKVNTPKIYDKSVEQKDKRIHVLDSENRELKKLKQSRVDTIYRDRIKYKTIYEKIPYSNSIDRDIAFDTLLSN